MALFKCQLSGCNVLPVEPTKIDRGVLLRVSLPPEESSLKSRRSEKLFLNLMINGCRGTEKVVQFRSRAGLLKTPLYALQFHLHP